MADSEAQSDELLALVSIYPDQVLKVPSSDHDTKDGLNAHSNEEVVCTAGCQQGNFLKFLAAVNLPDILNVFLTQQSYDNIGASHNVKYLPPITLKVIFPSDYPSKNSPKYEISCPWLSDNQLSALRAELDLLWSVNIGSVILFQWISFLQDSTFDHLALSNPLELPPAIYSIVVAHDQEQRDAMFATTLFTCLVCFRERPGSVSMKFTPCEHVFCRDCIAEYFESQISDGDVRRLNCLYQKCTSEATPGQVKDLVRASTFERYDRLLLRSTMDSMNDLVYCPPKDCACPVEIDHKDLTGSCRKCEYVFCISCMKAYHYKSPCPSFTCNVQDLRSAYLQGTPAEKKLLEMKYGRNGIIMRLKEERFSNDWLQEHSRKCPKCQTQIQKEGGCNMVVCKKCHVNFCWICLNHATYDNPYKHYSNPNTKCYKQLFSRFT